MIGDIWPLPYLGEYDPSALILVTVGVVAILAWVLLRLGVVRFVLALAGRTVRFCVGIGFGFWRRTLSWALWPFFAAVVGGLLALAWLGGDAWPWVGLICGVVLVYMGVVTCLAYMFIDLERYEVGRGYKALHNPLKGQALATNLVRYGPQVGLPLLFAAALATVTGFALLNQGLYRTVGHDWYDAGLKKGPLAGQPPVAVVEEDELTFVDFLAYPIINLLRIVDLMDFVNSYKVLEAKHVHPHKWPASVLLAGFKTLFTLVLLQQIFASLRWGKLLAETIAEFWSPHEPIQERARGSLPQHGIAAVRPLLVSLRSVEFLTKEQREQIPLILARIGPGAVPMLVRHLHDPHESVRAISAAALGHLHAADALPALVQLRHDTSDWVRQSLVEALGDIGNPTGRSIRRSHVLCRTVSSSTRLLDFVLRRKRVVRRIDPAVLMVDTLRAATADPVVAVRTGAARALGLIGTPALVAVPELLHLLQDAEVTVRGQAAEALGQVGGVDQRVLDALIGLLADVEAPVRASAAKALGLLKKEAADAVPALLPLMQDRDDAVRQAVADALRQIGTLNGEHTTQLTEGLESPDTAVRAETAEALGTIGESAAEATPALMEALADPNDRVRGKAAEALGKIGEAAAEAVPHLVRALRDKDSWVSALAAEALGEMGDVADGAVPALVQSLRHLNAQVRANAAETLGKMGRSAVVAGPALEKAAGDEDGEVRARAVGALGEIGQPAALADRVVRAALTDEDPQVRAAAAEAVGKLGRSDATVTADLLRALEDTHDAVQVQAAKALAKLGDTSPAVIEALVRLLDEDAVWVQVTAALALAEFGPSAAAAGPALLRAAQTGEVTVREYAVRALILLQSPETLPALTAGLADANADIRKMASAGFIKSPSIPDEVVPLMVEALRDPEVQVRANAAHALARLEALPPEAVAPLIECTADANDGLRMNAAMALENAPPAEVADVFAQLIDDPNSRLRLIAAGFLLTQDAANERAASVVSAALGDPALRLRKAALDVIAGLGERGAAWLEALRERSAVEDDADLRTKLAELTAKLEPTGEPAAPSKGEPVA